MGIVSTVTRGRRRAAVVAAIGLAAMTAGLVAAPMASAATPASWTKYCRTQGGVVQVRTPAAGTNSPPVLRLAGPVAFCRFTSAQDGSRIFIDLHTLTTTQPTLAGIAYLAKPPVGKIPGNVNPASIYCSRLGGSDQFGGVNASGGGWILGRAASTAVEACTFPDGSIMDSFGLLYHSQNIVRGADLTTKLRYRPTTIPSVFG